MVFVAKTLLEDDADAERDPIVTPQLQHPSKPEKAMFIVCGLGSIGQNCVAVLHQYGAKVIAIELNQTIDWELPNLAESVETVHIGDCRKANVLESAGIHHCRGVLLVTDNERTNTEAAFAARLLNPNVRLVVRSSKQNLNQLLSKNLGSFVAFEPIDLSASAFAFAALGSDVPGFFKLEDQWLRVVNREIRQDDRWRDRRQLKDLTTSSRRVLLHLSAAAPSSQQFYSWDADATLMAGDTVVYIELLDRLVGYSPQLSPESQQQIKPTTQQRQSQKTSAASSQRRRVFRHLRFPILNGNIKQKLIQFWQSTAQYQTRRVAIICGLAVSVLWCLGIVLYRLHYPQISLAEAFYAPVVLLLGGYGDLFGGVRFVSEPPPAEEVPWGLRLFSLGLTLAGTAFVGVLYALLTEALLTAKFQFKNRPPIPKQNHVVIIGLGRVGQRIAAILQDLKQPVVGIDSTALESSILPQMPMVVGNISEALTQVNLAQAQTTVVVLGDDMENLEIGLMVHAANPHNELVIRTQDQLFSNNVAQLFPYAQVLCAPVLSAEVFAAAAYGENILSLFHLNHQTILVTEYTIEPEDTLNGLLLAEVAYGFDVVPVLHQRSQSSPNLLPSDDVRLEAGDRLILLASTQSLQRIEHAELKPPGWQVQVTQALNQDAIFEGANEITRISGCSISTARQIMISLPALVPTPLYKHQAQRLIRNLQKARVTAHLMPLQDGLPSLQE
ncbi:NAD-binding protein [Leptolyngbyaceae cyanobacterium UHCC 1019]